MDSKPNPGLQKSMTRALFIESLIGNIKEKYFFEKKLGSGGYGAVYLAKNKVTGKCHSIIGNDTFCHPRFIVRIEYIARTIPKYIFDISAVTPARYPNIKNMFRSEIKTRVN